MLPDQVGPVRLDHLGTDQQAQGGEDPAEDPGHRGLARAGRPGEHEVPDRGLTGQALPFPQPGHSQLGRNLVHLPFDRLQADQLVELGERAFQGRRLAVAAEPGGELGPGPLQVGRLQGDQFRGGRLRAVGHDPDVPGPPGLLEQAADEPAVAELVGEPAAAHVLHHPPQRGARVGVEDLAALLQGELGQGHQLGG